MLTDAFRDSKEGILIRYRADRKLLNQRRWQAVTKVKETVIKDFLFAGDCAVNDTSAQGMQVTINRLSGSCNNFGLTISTKKAKALYQPCPGKPHQNPSNTVKGEVFNSADKFTYLGSTLSRHVNIDKEVKCRIAKASSAFGRLRQSLWECRGIGLSTKAHGLPGSCHHNSPLRL